MFDEKKFWKWRFSFLFNRSWIIRKWILVWILENSKYIKWNVLDFWCWEKPYKDLLIFKNYEGLDFPKTWHDNTANDIEIYWDWKIIPRWDNTYDSFICTEVLEHIFNIDDVLSEIYRVLKPWWYWIITIPFMYWEHEAPYDFARYTYFWIEDILKQHKFKIVNHKRLWNRRSCLCQLLVLSLSERYNNINYWVHFLLIPFYYSLKIIIQCISLFPCKNENIYLNNLIVVKK